MRVLVTGGAGFVGYHLISRLIDLHPNTKITVLDNYFTGKIDNHIDGVTYITGSTWDIDTYFGSCEPFDVVYHFGEYSRIATSFDDVDYVMKSNLHGSIKVLEMCKKWGAKLIYSASSSKFGDGGKNENLSPYAWTKSKMVELIKNYHEWFGLQYEICYFYNVYGPRQIKEGDYATVIGIFERQYKNGESLTVVSPGTQSRDFTHVKDIVLGVIKTTKINMNREWFLRSGNNYKIIDVAKIFTENIVVLPERKGERFIPEEFHDDTKKVLDWTPKYELTDWIKKIKND